MATGLLTYHWVPNYGANLQTLSSYSFLQKNGYNPIIINWVPEQTKEYYKNVCSEQQLYSHYSFIASHCKLTREFSNQSEIQDIIREYKIEWVVIGSDSLFNIVKKQNGIILPDHKFPNLFWGFGFEKIPHVALSVSNQNADYQILDECADLVTSLLSAFRCITVRDDWTQKMVNYFCEKMKSKVTPDPVFAFNHNVPELPTKTEIQRKYNLPNNYIILCFNDSRTSRAPKWWLKILKYMFHRIGVACISLPKSTGGQVLDNVQTINNPINPIDWYSIIRYSDGYIGVIIVCLHNHVPFFSFDHYGKGMKLFSNKKSSKIYSILKKAKLLKYHFYQKNRLLFPLPWRVFWLIRRFPVERCEKFSEEQQERCVSNMFHLMQELSND